MIRIIKSFFRRRLYIDVGPNDIVLDVGSGDKPHWRADVLLEKYPSNKFANQRSEGGFAVIDRCTVLGDVQDMPFKDKVFDYVICSHLLEHVEHPDWAVQEIERVGKRGYIEVPFEGAQKLYDFQTHLWYVHSEDEKMIFTIKDKHVFDPYIHELMQTMVDEGVWGRFTAHNFETCIVTKHWQGEIPIELRGDLSKRVNHSEIIYSETNSKSIPFRRMVRGIVFGFVRFLYKNCTSHQEVKIESLLRCRQCGTQEFSAENNGYKCSNCGDMIIILQ